MKFDYWLKSLMVSLLVLIAGYSFTGSISSILLSILFFLTLKAYNSKGDVSNYYIILLILLLIPIFYNENVAPGLLFPLSNQTLFVLTISTLSIFTGFRLGEKVRVKKENINYSKKEVFLISIIGFIPFFNQLIFGFGDIIVGNFQAIRFLGSIPVFSSFVFFKYFGLIYLFRRKKAIPIILYELILIISVLSEFGKTSLLTFILVNIVCFIQADIIKKNNMFKFIIIMIPTIVGFVWYFNYHTLARNDYNIVEDLYSRGLINQSFPKYLGMVYLYAMSPLSNLEINIGNSMFNGNYSLGYWLVYPVVSLFKSSSNIFDSEFAFETTSFLNTINFSFYSFKDFSVFGSVLINLFLGIVIVYLYKKRSNSPLNLLCYIVWLQAGIELFFSNHFVTQTYPLIIFVFLFFYQDFLKKIR